ncbi:MAG: rod shape-determining protein RodA [Rhodospirillaceae bacterium]|nr:rod shape-determining protein RodA [Rhodospirillaceae bacterium]
MSDGGLLSGRLRRGDMSMSEKLSAISWSLIFWICIIAVIGFLMLYSAANGSFDPWTTRQVTRFILGLMMLLIISLIDIRFVMRYAYAIYAIVLMMLIFVELRGVVGGGAQRWIDFAGIINLQPSEFMKVALVLALARYFHTLSAEDIGKPSFLIIPIAMLLFPVILILRQPDLGTALLVVMGAGVLFFMAGVKLWKFFSVIVASIIAIPVVWPLLAAYQQKRILTFLSPELDPLGAGYHILQSKIAFGAGGLFGKGFMQGTQSHLNFLPEQQTDFIFTMLAEEFGLVGGATLIGLYVIVITYGFAIALRCRHQFGRLVAIGVTTTFFLYVFINVAMVMGLIPVVGVPLPLISYGGTALLTIMLCMGLLMSVHVHRDVQLGVHGGFDHS